VFHARLELKDGAVGLVDASQVVEAVRDTEYEDYQGQETMRRDTEAAFCKRCDEEDAGGRL
jgi:hypothetical protein